LRPALIFAFRRESVSRARQFIGKNGFKAPFFVLIVQKHDGNHAQRSLARVALRYFTLQILQEAVCEPIQRPFAPGILFVSRPAVRTDELHLVLLRIAV
jgi:hypothetical protein